MKIDESCINHNALRLISEIMSDPYSLCFTGEHGAEDSYHVLLMQTGEINGILNMAKAMKEVLETWPSTQSSDY